MGCGRYPAIRSYSHGLSDDSPLRPSSHMRQQPDKGRELPISLLGIKIPSVTPTAGGPSHHGVPILFLTVARAYPNATSRGQRPWWRPFPECTAKITTGAMAGLARGGAHFHFGRIVTYGAIMAISAVRTAITRGKIRPRRGVEFIKRLNAFGGPSYTCYCCGVASTETA